MTDQEVLHYHLLASELLLITGKVSFGMDKHLAEVKALQEDDPDWDHDDWLALVRIWADGLTAEDKATLDEWGQQTTPLQRARATLKAMDDAVGEAFTDDQRKSMMENRAAQLQRVIDLSDDE